MERIWPKERLDVDRGDIITLETTEGRREYKISGFVSTVLNGGNVAFANERFLKMDLGLYRFRGYTVNQNFLIRTSLPPERVAEDIKNRFSREYQTVDTLAAMEERESRMWSGILSLLKGFSVMVMLIGIFGVFNNFMVEFLSRQRTLAVIRSVGMSRRQTVKLMLIEAFSGGLIGGIMGCLGGLLFIIVMQFVLQTLNLALPMHYSLYLFIGGPVSGVLISILSSLKPAFQAANLNLVDAIKYE